jgi:hypothetical protein
MSFQVNSFVSVTTGRGELKRLLAEIRFPLAQIRV